MGLELSRIYKNASDETLRIDSIYMESTTNQLTSGTRRRTYQRRIQTNKVLGPASRTVDSIELLTNADTYEASSGSFTWVAWDSPPCECGMSDLPIVGSDV